MDKTSLQDKTLSWKAKGILSYMLSMPDDWTFYIDELIKHSTDGKASFRSGFKELQDKGYVTRIRKRNEKGTFDWETIVHERPCTDFPQVDKPQVDKPQVDNRTLLSNDELITNSTKNDKDKPSFSEEQKIFDHYISKKIIKHTKFDSKMKSSSKRAIKNYGIDEVLKVIDNYAAIYESDDYWFNTKYTLVDILRDKDLRQFGDEAEPFHKFAINKKKKNYSIPSDDRVEVTDELYEEMGW